ncbi:MAG TPA: MATE family efflux transporter [Candidatus Evtepia faecigallinarum]|nr:MATE family efflux transporter [Candidatus Evtepia faecigallinarum]
MGVMPIGRLLLTMSGPMMISMLIQALYNVVDSMFVSYISEAALTAVSLAYPMQNLMIAVATGTGVGINALLSRNLGEKNFPMVNRTAGNAIFLGLVSYVVFALVGLFGSRIYFTLQVTDPEIIQMGQDYLSVIMVLSIGCFGQVLLSRLLQSTGKTFYSMVIQMVGAGLNIILDPIMIFGLVGFPAMGVAGAALATVVSQIVGTLLGLYYNLRKNPEIQFAWNQLRPSGPIIARIYGVGVPSILLQTVSSLLIFGLNQILVAFSETATAVYGVYFKLQGFAFLPIIGMNNGMVPIIAYNYGAKKPERILQTIKLSITYAVVIMVVAVIVFQVFAAQLLGFFQASPEMLAIGVPALRTLSLCFIIGGFTIVSSSVFQALGRGLLSMSISVFRQLVLVLPLAYLFSLTGNLNMVWWSFPVAEVLAGLLAAYYLRRAYLRVIRPLADEDYHY